MHAVVVPDHHIRYDGTWLVLAHANSWRVPELLVHVSFGKKQSM